MANASVPIQIASLTDPVSWVDEFSAHVEERGILLIFHGALYYSK